MGIMISDEYGFMISGGGEDEQCMALMADSTRRYREEARETMKSAVKKVVDTTVGMGAKGEGDGECDASAGAGDNM